MLTVSYDQGDRPTNDLGFESTATTPCRSKLPYKIFPQLITGKVHTWTIRGSETKTQVAEKSSNSCRVLAEYQHLPRN